MKKRTIAFALALVLVLSLACTSALAATKPSMKLVSLSTTSIKRGKTQTWKFRVDCGSYKMKNGAYRTKLGSFIVKGSASGKMLTGITREVTGKGLWTVKFTPAKTAATGKYVNLYATYFRNGTGSYKCNFAKTKNFKIKK